MIYPAHLRSKRAESRFSTQLPALSVMAPLIYHRYQLEIAGVLKIQKL